jgi:hypothetical protein
MARITALEGAVSQLLKGATGSGATIFEFPERWSGVYTNSVQIDDSTGYTGGYPATRAGNEVEWDNLANHTRYGVVFAPASFTVVIFHKEPVGDTNTGDFNYKSTVVAKFMSGQVTHDPIADIFLFGEGQGSFERPALGVLQIDLSQTPLSLDDVHESNPNLRAAIDTLAGGQALDVVRSPPL